MRRMLPVYFIVALAAVASCCVAVARAQDSTGAAAPAAAPANGAETPAANAPAEEQASKKDFLTDMYEGFMTNWRVGGNTMWGLLGLGIVAVVCIIERLVNLRRGKIAPRGLADQANKLWHAGRYTDLVALGRKSNSTLGRIIVFLAAHRGNSYEHLTSAAEDIAARDFEVHNRGSYPLSAVGTLSPLLGLLGTVFGLLGAFATIKVVGSMDNPSALAGNIGEALITTAAGLIVAIPALIMYHYFVNRTSLLAGVVGEEVSAMMHDWFLATDTGGVPPIPQAMKGVVREG